MFMHVFFSLLQPKKATILGESNGFSGQLCYDTTKKRCLISLLVSACGGEVVGPLVRS